MKVTSDSHRKWWSAAVLIPAALVCLGYILYKRDFAKFHLDISNLNFPIFIGEMLLFFCLAALVLRCLKDRTTFQRVHVLIGLYLVWLLLKTSIGYAVWGPLALRHAAMFYYPLFFIIGYVFFSRESFNRWTIFALFSAIIMVLLWRVYDRYWTFTLMSLGLVLCLRTKNRNERMVMMAVLALSAPYVFLFKTARMMFVANLISIGFVGGCVWFLLNLKSYVKWSILAVALAVFSVGFYKFFILGDSGRVFVGPSKVIEAFHYMDMIVQHKKPQYQPEVLPVALYHSPNGESRSYHYYQHQKSQHQNSQHQSSSQHQSQTLRKDEAVPSNPSSVNAEDSSSPKSVWQEYSETYAQAAEESQRTQSSGMRLVSGKEESYAVVRQQSGSYLQDVQDVQEVESKPVVEITPPIDQVSLNNIIFRFFIWRDMFDDWKAHRCPWLGMSFGWPLRSVSLEVSQWAAREWGRDGWIEPHNSFFHILYRAGVIGLGFIGLILWATVRLIRTALQRKSWVLVLLTAILLNWMVAANFLLILEVPYTAIPFWLIAGMTWAYAFKDQEAARKVS